LRVSIWFFLVMLVVEISFCEGTYVFLKDVRFGNIVLEHVPDEAIVSDKVVGLDIYLGRLVKDIDYLVLGVCSDYTLVEKLGRYLGGYLKKLGVDFLVFGTFKTLNGIRSLKYVSRSPFVTAHVLSLFARGLQTAGVVPVLDMREGFNEDVIRALVSRHSFFPFVVREESVARKIKDLGIKRPFLLDKGDFWTLKDGVPNQLEYSWHDEASREKLEDVRREILMHAMVILQNPSRVSRKMVVIDDPWEKLPKDAKVILIFSDDPWLKKLAEKALNGEFQIKGRRTW